MEHNKIDNKILGHKNFAENMSKNLTKSVKVVQLQTEKLASVRYVPEGNIKSSSEEPSVTELKKLLKMTEEELFDAKKRIIDLEQRGGGSGSGSSPGADDFERRFEIFKKSIVVNLDNLFGQLRVVRNVLEMNQVHIGNVMNNLREFVGLEHLSEVGARREQLIEKFREEVQDLKKLMEENQGCLGAIARIDAEMIKRPVLELLHRGFEFPKEGSSNQGVDIDNLVNEKIDVLLAQGGMREDRYQKISERINELEGILKNQDGLTGTAKKLIELEKKLNQTEGEKDQLERQYKGLQRESLEMNQEFKKVAEEYESLRRSMVQLTSSQDLDAVPKAIWNDNMKEYVQKMENEFL